MERVNLAELVGRESLPTAFPGYEASRWDTNEIVLPLTWGDYVGNLVERANARVVRDEYSALFDAGILSTSWAGGYGSEMTVLDVDMLRETPDHDEALVRLGEELVAVEEQYPLMSDEVYSELEMELLDEQRDYIVRDLARDLGVGEEHAEAAFTAWLEDNWPTAETATTVYCDGLEQFAEGYLVERGVLRAVLGEPVLADRGPWLVTWSKVNDALTLWNDAGRTPIEVVGIAITAYTRWSAQWQAREWLDGHDDEYLLALLDEVPEWIKELARH